MKSMSSIYLFVFICFCTGISISKTAPTGFTKFKNNFYVGDGEKSKSSAMEKQALSESLTEKTRADKDQKQKWAQFVPFGFVYRLETELRHVIDNKKVKESSTRAPLSEEQRIERHRSKFVVHPGDCLYSAFACPIFKMRERAQKLY